MSIMEKIDRLMIGLYRGIAYITFAAFLVMLLIVLIQVFCRYVLGNSLSWSEETARYLSVWITFLAIGLAFYKGELIGIDFVASLIPEKAKPLFESASHAVVLFFIVIIIKYGFALAAFSMNQSAPTLRISMGYVYGAVPVGSLVMGIFVLWSLTRIWWAAIGKRIGHA